MNIVFRSAFQHIDERRIKLIFGSSISTSLCGLVRTLTVHSVLSRNALWALRSFNALWTRWSLGAFRSLGSSLPRVSWITLWALKSSISLGARRSYLSRVSLFTLGPLDTLWPLESLWASGSSFTLQAGGPLRTNYSAKIDFRHILHLQDQFAIFVNSKVWWYIPGIGDNQVPILVHIERILTIGRNSHAVYALRPLRAWRSLYSLRSCRARRAFNPLYPLRASRASVSSLSGRSHISGPTLYALRSLHTRSSSLSSCALWAFLALWTLVSLNSLLTLQAWLPFRDSKF